MIRTTYDVIIIGTGPAGLGAAFHLADERPGLDILMVDKAKMSTGGLRNDCKQNYTFPIGFAGEYWSREEAEEILPVVRKHLQPRIMEKNNLSNYRKRAEQVGVSLLDVKQAHVGTDGALQLHSSAMPPPPHQSNTAAPP